MDLEPKNKDRDRKFFYECCDLMKKYIQTYLSQSGDFNVYKKEK